MRGVQRQWKMRAVLVVATAYVVALAVVAGTLVIWWDRLPDPMASHFGSSGEADGFAGRAALLWTAVPLLVGMGGMFAAMVGVPRVVEPAARLLVAGGAATAGLLGAVLTSATAANLDLARAADARLALTDLFTAVATAGVAGTLSWWIVGAVPEAGVPATAGPATAAAAAVPLAKGEVLVWSRRVGSRVMVVTAVLVLLSSLVCALLGLWMAAVLSLLSAVPVAALARVTVTVDRRGLRVAPSGLAAPAKTIDLDEVASAGVRDVNAFREFGGWGYRVRSGATGVVMRSGEALCVRLRSGREFVVVVGDARQAAETLNALAGRRRDEDE
ncbi:DUF1648 domain-containing protein [Streptomyces spiramenti]|uniref:DUF1648 domain-containing protein n=1 Tax=Streptomyces spiramenti TaxID=2720606 RepID=A0ABX1AKH6_9ACTN|nr:DUF1648 domain-containing protein [Streptomyces spiramenti]NJP65878.1 DUF1648 domain-containing protein [Streptomyces spiramenti]